MICPKCKCETEDGAIFCSECGTRIVPVIVPAGRSGAANAAAAQPQTGTGTDAAARSAGSANMAAQPGNANAAGQRAGSANMAAQPGSFAGAQRQSGQGQRQTGQGQYQAGGSGSYARYGSGQNPYGGNTSAGGRAPYGQQDQRRQGAQNPRAQGQQIMQKPSAQNRSAAAGRKPAGKTRKAEKKSSPAGLILALVLVILLAAAGILAVHLLSKKSDTDTADAKETTEESGTAEDGGDDAEAAGTEDADGADGAEDAEGTDDAEADQTDDAETPTATPIPTAESAAAPDPSEITVSVVETAPTSLTRLEVATATSTSELVQENTDPNNAWMVLDQRDETSWQESETGSGLGEKLNFSFSGEQKVRYLSFKLGCWRENYYEGNNAPQTLTIRMGELEFTATFPHEQKEYWVILSEAWPTSDVEIEVTSVYKGTSWDDTAIAEIGLYGE